MEICNEILRTIERIERDLVQIRKLSQNVTHDDVSQPWVQGGCAALVTLCILLLGLALGR